MNSIAVILAVGLCFAVGQALQCYKCPLGIWNLCVTTKTTCESGEVCYNSVGSGAVIIKRKGCTNATTCNTPDLVTFGSNTTFYTLTKTCCNTDLCNMAPGLPGASGLSLAAVTIFYLLVANLMA
ncbi:ly6/PLAUR domain-containing protein 2 [Fundulus heteroclitus]|uniref:ly6/PLAUR domain-containing protein 2 n=1 Tax=Fundulus heteroclitus TaxID=8078 RepID=UPI00165A8F0F|nr:ly6/PLAUR domain-containing protein 2 [Fundulus heteroclitus]